MSGQQGGSQRRAYQRPALVEHEEVGEDPFAPDRAVHVGLAMSQQHMDSIFRTELERPLAGGSYLGSGVRDSSLGGSVVVHETEEEGSCREEEE